MPASELDWSTLIEDCAAGLSGAEAALDRLVTALPQLRTQAASPAPGQPYGRSIPYATRTAEILLVNWAEGEVSAPHQHGGSDGFIFLLAGQLEELHWRWNGATLTSGNTRRFSSPCVFPVNLDVIHSTKGISAAFSVHVYRPPIQGMKVFDLIEKRTLTVSDDCGAWIPSDARFVRSIDAWKAP